MKIGITGATGFVGSHLVRSLFREGHHIIAFGRQVNPPKQLTKFAQYIQWDLAKEVPDKSFGIDVFIHCAGYVEFWGSFEEMYTVNVEGTNKVLEYAKGAKHFIYISTASVYGSLREKHTVSEDTPYPKTYSNNYGLTKSLAEKAVIKNVKKFERITIIRPHVVYGPGDRTIIPRILKSIKGNNMFIIGPGNNNYSITHIGNICYGTSLILKRKTKGFSVYNLTDLKPVSINDIYSQLIQSLHLRIKIIHLPYFLLTPFIEVVEFLYKLLKVNSSPRITKEIAKQFTQESTLSLNKITLDLKYSPPFNYRGGFSDLNTWIHSTGGIKKYISSPADCWKGKLKTY